MALSITSPAFAPGAEIPVDFTCESAGHILAHCAQTGTYRKSQ